MFFVSVAKDPVQEWGEEHEDGAVFGITLHREPVQQAADPTEAFVQYRTCKVRRLKAATLDKLVSQLLDPCCQERDYGRILLSTYRTFTSSNKLTEMLLQRCVHIHEFVMAICICLSLVCECCVFPCIMKIRHHWPLPWTRFPLVTSEGDLSSFLYEAEDTLCVFIIQRLMIYFTYLC